MRYILTGTPQAVADVLQENRIRVQRGVISFTPADDAEADDKAAPADDDKTPKATPDSDTKTPKRKR